MESSKNSKTINKKQVLLDLGYYGNGSHTNKTITLIYKLKTLYSPGATKFGILRCYPKLVENLSTNIPRYSSTY